MCTVGEGTCLNDHVPIAFWLRRNRATVGKSHMLHAGGGKSVLRGGYVESFRHLCRDRLSDYVSFGFSGIRVKNNGKFSLALFHYTKEIYRSKSGVELQFHLTTSYVIHCPLSSRFQVDVAIQVAYHKEKAQTTAYAVIVELVAFKTTTSELDHNELPASLNDVGIFYRLHVCIPNYRVRGNQAFATCHLSEQAYQLQFPFRRIN